MPMISSPTPALGGGPEYALAPDVALVVAPDGSGRILDLDGNSYAVPAPGGELLQVALERGPAAAVQQVADRVGIIRAGRLIDVDQVAALRARSIRHVTLTFAEPVDPGPFAVVEARKPITSEEFATAYEVWSAAHPLWH